MAKTVETGSTGKWLGQQANGWIIKQVAWSDDIRICSEYGVKK